MLVKCFLTGNMNHSWPSYYDLFIHESLQLGESCLKCQDKTLENLKLLLLEIDLL